MKYFSYGMNTNLESMAARCPRARSLGRVLLPHYKFEFKVHATVTPEFNEQTWGVLWDITPECELSLDALEGYPNYYQKIYVAVQDQNGDYQIAMTYLMYPEEVPNYPSTSYLKTLQDGYQAHGIEFDQLTSAINSVKSSINKYSDYLYNTDYSTRY